MSSQLAANSSAALTEPATGSSPTPGAAGEPTRHAFQLAAWARAALLTIGIAGCTGISVLTGHAMGLEPRLSVILSLPVGMVVGFLLALLLILIPDWRAHEDRRWLVDCLRDVSRVDREQKFGALLSHGKDHELHELATAIHAAMLSAHRDRLEAAQLRRELDARVTRRTKAVVAELSKLTHTDDLSGLMNRRGFDAGFIQLFDATATSGEELSLLAIDLDLFKQLNDTYGHDKGDQALRAAGEVLRAQLREGDLAGRIGGDEFMIALRGTGSAQAQAVARRLIDLYKKSPAALTVPTSWPTLSIGIACAGEHKAEGPEHLRKLADLALYAAKRGGRSGFVLYTAGCEGGPSRESTSRAA